MSREDLHTLLERYLKNQSSPEEKLLVEKLYGMLDKEDLPEVIPDELSALEEKLWHNIKQQSAVSDNHQYRNGPGTRLWYAAAVISVISLLAGYIFLADARNPQYTAFQKYADLLEKTNSGKTPLGINLEDGSKVVLQPKSSLRYPAHFKPGQREVLLHGEGYFLISKNHKRPFFVYSNNVITRVVGTSFTVRSGNSTAPSEVIVRTGKVVVIPNQDRRLSLSELFRKQAKAVLTPNQKTVYSPDKGSFENSLVPEPLPSADALGTKNQDVFEDTPLTEVVAALQRTYGIEIVIKDQSLRRNTFTGDISNRGLYKKIDLICSAMGAGYVISGTRIIIQEKKR
ncbi:MAG: FecR domain-containing protein [Pedobacter sp.]|uniref:FecR family protein n=1 Tax=Pedobacter sp. TaxID=1411316 RepID=UPI003397983B